MKLSSYVIDFIARLGVRHVFFLPGGAAMHLNDSLGRHPDIYPVCNLHEQACAIAAEAYAKVSGSFGVAMVTAGPGSTNAVTGVASAWLDSDPVHFLSGQVKAPDLKRGTDNCGSSAFRKKSALWTCALHYEVREVTIDDPSSVLDICLERGIHEASKRGGRVRCGLIFPLDVQAADIEPDRLKAFLPQRAVGSPADLTGGAKAVGSFH